MIPGEAANMPRFRGGQSGFFEVWFVEVQDDLQETGLLLRYTLRSPTRGNGPKVAELWAMHYDRGDPRKSFGLKRTIPFSSQLFSHNRFQFQIGDASIDHLGCRGRIEDQGRSIGWDLKWSDGELLMHYPYTGMYASPFPTTKVLSPHFDMRATGTYSADGRERRMSGVPGQQSHVWGTEQSRRWRWCHAGTFQEDPGAAFEALTVDVPLIPTATMFALKLGGETYLFHGPLDLVSGNESRTDVANANKALYPVSRWTVGGGDENLRFRGEVSAPLETYLGIELPDPDGSKRFCSHSKLAEVRLEVLFPDGNGGWRVGQTLTTGPSAALEFAGSVPDPRVPITVT